jgi:hypothetical protein
MNNSRGDRILSNEVYDKLNEYNDLYIEFDKGQILSNSVTNSSLKVFDKYSGDLIFKMDGVNSTYGDVLLSKSKFYENCNNLLNDYKNIDIDEIGF